MIVDFEPVIGRGAGTQLTDHARTDATPNANGHDFGGVGQVKSIASIIADAEAGFGGALNVLELMKAMIEAGAAAVHFDDRLALEK